MRLGGNVFGYTDAESWALKHIEKGFGAAYWPLGADAAPEEEKAYASAARRHGLVIAEVGGWCNLLDSDPEKREANIRYDIARLQTAERVGALCCVNISGSRDEVWDAPHPDNLTEETFRMVVKNAQRIIDESGARRAFFSYEPMPSMYPTGVEDTRRLITAVNRPNFGVHVDMANMMNNLDKIYHSGDFTRQYLSSFPGLIHSIHAKDSRVEKKLTLHIQECDPGEGIFDFRTLLEEADRLDGVCVMLEHMQTEAQYDRSADHIRGIARSLGLTFTEGRA